MGYTGAFFLNILYSGDTKFFGCVWVSGERKKNVFEKSAFFRVCSPKPFGQNGHFGPYIPISHPQYSKSI